jgi:hypothetical protein
MASQLFPIPLGVGVGGKDDPFQLPPNKLLQLYNGIFRYTNRVDLRWGYNSLGKQIVGSNLTITSGAAINAFEQELLIYDNTYAYSYSKTENAWLNRGIERSVIVSSQLIIANNNQQLSPDLAILNGIEVFVWEDSLGTLRYSVFDSSVGNVILNNNILYTGCPSANVRPKAMSFAASNMIPIFFVNASGQLLFVVINPNNPTKINTYAQILANGLSNPAYYDATVVGSSIYIAYYTSTSVQLIQVNSNFIIQSQVQVATISSVPTGSINVGSDLLNNIYVSFVDNSSNTTVQTAVYSSSLVQLSAPTATITQSTGTIASVASINGMVYAEAKGSVVGGVYNNVIYQNTISTAGTVGSTSVFIRSLGLASKPFYYNGVVYVNVASQSALQPTYFTLDSSANVVAKMLPGLGGGLIQSSDYTLPECPSYSTGIFKFPNLQYGVPISEEGVVFGLLGVNCTTLNFYNSNQFLSAIMNNSLYTVGGILQQYDGSKYFESGYRF